MKGGIKELTMHLIRKGKIKPTGALSSDGHGLSTLLTEHFVLSLLSPCIKYRGRKRDVPKLFSESGKE